MIIIDGVKFETNSLEVNPHESEEGKIIVDFKFKVIGEFNYNLYSNSLKSGPVKIQIPEKNIETFAKKKSYSTSSTGELSEKNTSFTVRYEECDENEKTWTEAQGLNLTTMMNWARTRAIAELLVEKKIISHEDYEKRILEVFERDREEMVDFISTGKPINLN